MTSRYIFENTVLYESKNDVKNIQFKTFIEFLRVGKFVRKIMKIILISKHY